MTYIYEESILYVFSREFSVVVPCLRSQMSIVIKWKPVLRDVLVEKYLGVFYNERNVTEVGPDVSKCKIYPQDI